jgi:hypothetical protein
MLAMSRIILANKCYRALKKENLYIIVRFEVFTAVTMKNGVFWDVTPCAFVRTDVSEEPSASFIRVTRIGELGTTLAATSNRRRQRASVFI